MHQVRRKVMIQKKVFMRNWSRSSTVFLGKKKAKQSRYRPGVAQRVPGS
jgi:hypothetical protein